MPSKSSTGQYFIGLDHIRGLAAFLVFVWHFLHANAQYADAPPIFPLSILTEGHTGVALFMALSGYIFARLLDGKSIIYSAFIWNRILRLAPLLFVFLVLKGFEKCGSIGDIPGYIQGLTHSFLAPARLYGAWSVMVEFHFYLLLPLLLLLVRKSKYSLFFVFIIVLLARWLVYESVGTIQYYSYGTLFGRIDQFLFGILACQFRNSISGRHILVMGLLFAYASFYWFFDYLGGFYANGAYPSPSSIWVLLPAIEGFAYAILIAWYDCSFKHSEGKVSRFFALFGTYSYSIYLLHFFVVFRLAIKIDRHFVDLSNVYLGILASIPCFIALMPVCYVSYRYIEKPFLKRRIQYIKAD